MQNETNDIFSVWRPSSQPVLEQVFSDRIPLVLVLSHGLTGSSLAQKFRGKLSKINGNLVNFRIESQQTIPTTGPAKMAQGTVVADVYFNLTVQKPNGMREPIGYAGEGNVMDVVTDTDGKPNEILLRVAHGFTTRRLRREERMPWLPTIQSTIGFDTVARIPETRDELKAILDNCVHNIYEPSILNISAGGICIKLNMAAAKKSSSPLFFLLLTFQEKDKHSVPFFFIAKKVGFHYEENSQEADGLRFLLQHELDWGASQATLEWKNIESTGSENLRSILYLLYKTDSHDSNK
ncbi:MAG: hypothetical protein IJU76_07845 [Desulfovibrionaceae bacterium]|nr:hypothetical protein [Desulfovibrionaceae bacterium]